MSLDGVGGDALNSVWSFILFCAWAASAAHIMIENRSTWEYFSSIKMSKYFLTLSVIFLHTYYHWLSSCIQQVK